MSVVAQVKDGKIVESQTASSIANSKVKDKSTLDKDAFLGLLVAQMKYQDPLEPTSNTEFVSQYAQFTSLEQMQNMSATLELSRASSLVGQIVSVNTLDSNGQTTTIQGKVDYIIYENNKAYVSIGDALYSLDEVYAVADQEYLDASDLAYEFAYILSKLPEKKEYLTLDDKEAVDKLNEIYEGMTDYQKTFIGSDTVKLLEEYTERIEELAKDQKENNAILAEQFVLDMGKLPKLEDLTLDDKKAINKLNETYDSMTDHQKTLIGSELKDKLKEYTERMEQLVKDQE